VSCRYLNRVDKNLVLNIYTAITNPITNEGRVELCKGALANVDLRETVVVRAAWGHGGRLRLEGHVQDGQQTSPPRHT
jgi:hypothetical protein